MQRSLPTTVTLLLDALGQHTRVTLIHSGFASVTDISDYRYGWTGYLEQLAATA